jgi:hypothetical protein
MAISPLHKNFATNKDLEKQGIWFEYGLNSKDQPIRFKVARCGGANREYTTYMEAITKPYRRMIQNETISEDILTKILRDAFVTKALKGWEGVEDRELKDLPFSKDAALKYFDELPELFKDLQDQGGKYSLYLEEEREIDAKN